MAGGTGAGGGIATTEGREARAFLHELAQLQAGGGEEVGCEVGGAGAAQYIFEGPGAGEGAHSQLGYGGLV